MAKPSITKRTTKGTALTYSELDTNFQNLADATVTITGGSTAVTADLNGNITLVAGTGITITGNNTAKTITVNSSAGGITDLVQDTSPQLGGNLDTNSFAIIDSTDSIVKINNDSLRLGDGAGIAKILTQSGQNLQLREPFTDDSALTLGVSGVIAYGNLNVVGSTITLTTSSGSASLTTSNNGQTLYLRTDGTNTSAQISVGAGNNGSVGFVGNGTGYVFSNSAFRLATMTTSTRDGLTAVNGMMIYNSTTHKFQGYANGVWVDLH